MPLTKEQAKENLKILIERFESEKNKGVINDYNEEATKTAFIQPLLKDVLGWNVNDRNEVSPEEKVSRDRVDYGIKINGKLKLFIEAKPIKADLNKHIEQAVKYGYNKKDVPFVLLTDFEGIKLFDVTVKPDSRNYSKGIKIDLSYDQYLNSFNELWKLSKESVLNGELDKLIAIKPKDRIPVDKAILEDLQRWRESLAKDIYKNNPSLFHSGDSEKDGTYLKEITQKLLDRLIFMRFSEDREFMHRPTLKTLFNDRTDAIGISTIAVLLKEEFKHYNIVFDSDLFSPKDWEDKLAIEFKVLNKIIEDLYNPYQFDVIPLDVLGNIYEQYLGYTIRLTEHQVKYEQKPEVRKAGGVYYTPQYIVDYIVKNTVGKLLQDLPASKIKNLRILDPACGSGSFLIRAYEEMLNYYRNQEKSQKHIEGQEKLELEHQESKKGLTIQKKNEILRDHIYGVDIDEQAVEVTRLSLMLKMLEDEHGIIPGRSLLPMLESNIKCGNSLISGTPQELQKYFSEKWTDINAFNWEDRFRKIMVDEGGFDVIIGNPPYVKEDVNREAFELIKKTGMKIYYQGKMDIWYFFACKAIDLLKENGLHSFIAQNNWITSAGASILRNKILEDTQILSFVDFNEFKVFFDASIQTMIYVMKKKNDNKSYSLKYFKILDKNVSSEELGNCLINNKQDKFIQSFNYKIERSLLHDDTIAFIDSTEEAIIEKIKGKANYFLQDKHIGNGIDVLQDFVSKKHIELLQDEGVKVGDGIFVLNEKELKCVNINKHESSKVKPYYTPEQLQKYYGNQTNQQWIIYADKDVRENISMYPNIKKHLDRFKKVLTSAFKPYGLHRPREQSYFEGEKIFSLRKTRNVSFTYSNFPCYVSRAFLVVKPDNIDIKYLIALLNSKLINFWLYSKGKKQGEQLQIDKEPLLKTPLIRITEKQTQDNIDKLVDITIELKRKYQIAKGAEKERVEQQINETDKQIDNIVYKLYGITEEERQIIEGT